MNYNPSEDILPNWSEEVVEEYAVYIELGFTHLYVSGLHDELEHGFCMNPYNSLVFSDIEKAKAFARLLNEYKEQTFYVEKV